MVQVTTLLQSDHVEWDALSCWLPVASSPVRGFALPAAVHRAHSACAIGYSVDVLRIYTMILWACREDIACAVAIHFLQL